MQAIDLTGQTFGRLTVRQLDHRRDKLVFWLCQCECGNTVVVRTKSLRSGNTKSCGCYQKTRAKEANITHGGASRREGEHPLYNLWCGMRRRCDDPKNNRYYCYGARGIRVCDAWHDFAQFKADMEPTWKPGLSIERKDITGNYCKENCCWIPLGEQNKNTSASHRITFKGRTMILQEWADEVGLNHTTLLWRMREGWTVEEILTTPRYSRWIRKPSVVAPIDSATD